jgi:hypothetical protein
MSVSDMILLSGRCAAGSPVCIALALALAMAGPAHAKTKRSAAAIAEFKRLNPCPATGQPRGSCPGYIIDHIQALACGGPDTAQNMQWQTLREAKAKDKWERIGCKKMR